MAHDVKFEVPKRPLGREDIVFEVRRGGQRFGKLLVSKGAIVWYPRSGKHGHKLSWTAFDALICDEGRKGRHR